MDQVVVLDETGHALDVADKAHVHHANTPLHLAFSCYIINSGNQVLLTRRAAGKKTWPGVWTNSCCGHPTPGEPLPAAVTRRLGDELDIHPDRVDLVLARFRYRAAMDNGITENEMCPVFRVHSETNPNPDPREVGDYRWTDWTELADAVTRGTLALSPWCTQQVRQLYTLGPQPHRWPTAPTSDLPPAGRHQLAERPRARVPDA